MSQANAELRVENAGLCLPADHGDRQGHQTRLPRVQRRHRGVEESRAAYATRAIGGRAWKTLLLVRQIHQHTDVVTMPVAPMPADKHDEYDGTEEVSWGSREQNFV